MAWERRLRSSREYDRRSCVLGPPVRVDLRTDRGTQGVEERIRPQLRGESERFQVAGTQRDHLAQVISALRSNPVDELRHEVDLVPMDERKLVQVDDEFAPAGGARVLKRSSQQPVGRDPVQSGDRAESLDRDASFPPLIPAERRGLEAPARQNTDIVKRQPPLLAG